MKNDFKFYVKVIMKMYAVKKIWTPERRTRNFVVSDFFKKLSDGKIFYRGEDRVLKFSPAKKILSRNTDRVQLAGLRTFFTKVGGQRRTFYEKDPILVETILAYDEDSD